MIYGLRWRIVYALRRVSSWCSCSSCEEQYRYRPKQHLCGRINNFSWQYIYYFISYLAQWTFQWWYKGQSSHVDPMSHSFNLCSTDHNRLYKTLRHSKNYLFNNLSSDLSFLLEMWHGRFHGKMFILDAILIHMGTKNHMHRRNSYVI